MTAFDPLPTLTTGRLQLRPLVPADAEVMLRLKSDPDVIRYLGRPAFTTLAQAAERIAEITKDIADGRAAWWGIGLRDGGALVGSAGYWQWNQLHHWAEVGYDLLPEHWGRGIMKEALPAILRFGFESMELHRVQACVDPDNHASSRLLEGLGFTREGLLRENWHHDGRYTDTIVYSLLRHEMAAEAPPSSATA